MASDFLEKHSPIDILIAVDPEPGKEERIYKYFDSIKTNSLNPETGITVWAENKDRKGKMLCIIDGIKRILDVPEVCKLIPKQPKDPSPKKPTKPKKGLR